MGAGEPVVEFNDVTVSYVRGTPAISGVSFRVFRDELVFLLGPNGGGKSTVLRAIAGLVRPERGTVRVFGVDVRRFREWWRVGYLPQAASSIFGGLPVSVGEFLRSCRVAEGGLDPVEALELVGADGPRQLLGERIDSLSAGNVQKVLLAGSLVNRPSLLLLDEPTVYVDQRGVSALIELLERLREEWGLTVILATHDVSAISTLANRVICINRGSLFDGPISELLGSESLCRIYGFHLYLVRHGH